MKINANFLLQITNNSLKDKEILSGYMKYYVAQGRNLDDLKTDYFRIATSPMKYNLFYRLEEKDIKQSIAIVENIFDSYLYETFNCHLEKSGGIM